MSNPISRLIERYNNLPKVSFCDRVRFAGFKYLQRKLCAKKIIDGSGELLEARFEKAKLPPVEHTYDKIIFTCGFGWSGSSATGDLIREYDGITGMPAEFDLARGAGGLYSLERAFETRSVFARDAAVRLFLALVDSLYVYTREFYEEKFLTLTRQFLNDLIDYVSLSPDGFDNCQHLKGLGTRSVSRVFGNQFSADKQPIFFLKNLTVAEYRRRAAAYIRSVLCLVNCHGMLNLDQGCADCSADMDRFADYFGDFKAIYTYRDPRDVFTAANNARRRGQNEGYIPGDAEGFVKWYQRALGPFVGVSHPNLMLLRFEDLIIDPEQMIPRIEQFLGLKPTDHVRPRTRFMPEESCAISLGLWREYDDQKSIDYIASKLPDYCYNKSYPQVTRKLYTSTGVRA